MSSDIPGWGSWPWGQVWGGGGIVPGGSLPIDPPHDIFCVHAGGEMSLILTHPEVTTVGSGGQITTDGPTGDLILQSGDSIGITEAQLILNTTVPEDWTLDWSCKFLDLPTSFGDLSNVHIFIGASDAAGACAGLFFSKTGLAYAGSIHIDGGGVMILDSVLQPLAGSQTLFEEGDYFSFRIATSFSTGVVYIYVTRTSSLPSIGQQLRYVLPIIPSSSVLVPPPDRTLVSVRGTAPSLSAVAMHELCLGSGVLIANAPPVADAGPDQAVRACTVLRLDGSRSFDPEGSPLTYQWRLIDAPVGSVFLFVGSDGATFPLLVPTGFTDHFYSVVLGVLNGTTPILVGDVVVVAGVPYTIVATGTDGHGFFVQIEDFLLPDNLAGSHFKFLPQSGLAGATTVNPTFFPDIAGLYKFDLIVSDGSLASPPAQVVAVVAADNVLPRGIIPDLTFLWDYLSDFWRLVEGRERVSLLWSSLAQVAATELLSLWQVDYSKSLRDVQRTFLRRWLHIDPLLQEPLPETTSINLHFRGISSSFFLPSATIAGVQGQHLDLMIPSLGGTFSIAFSAGSNPTLAEVRDLLQGPLSSIDPRMTARIDTTRSPPDIAVHDLLTIEAPFPFSIAATTTTNVALFTPGTDNSTLGGIGQAAGLNVYRVFGVSLSGRDLGNGDLLVVDGISFRIARIADDPTDQFPFQRIVLFDALPTSSATSWAIPGQVTSTQVDFYNNLVSPFDTVIFEVLDLSTDSLFEVRERVLAAQATNVKTFAVQHTVLGNYTSQPTKFSVFFSSILRRIYLPIDPLVVDLPTLQEKIKVTNDQEVLRKNVDFFLETFRGRACIRFVTTTNDPSQPDVWEGQDPPIRLWAETIYIDNRPTIEANFGLPAEFTLDDLSVLSANVDYLSAVRGLWYAYFNGPTVFDLRVGTQILLGLPFAEEAGIIEELRTDFSSLGRIFVRDSANTSILRSYTYPAVLGLAINPATGQLYQVGDAVTQFAPFVNGVEVLDWINTPNWFAGYLQQGSFFEIEKFHKFLVRIDSAAFNLASLLFVRSFILRIKPTYTFPLFVVLEKLKDTEVSVSDSVALVGHLNFFTGGAFNGEFASATMFDQPDPSPEGPSVWQNRLDAGSDPALGALTYPTSQLVQWGLDKNYLCPEDAVYGKLTTVVAAPGPIPLDSGVFALDTPVFTNSFVWEGNHVFQVPAAGLQIDVARIVPSNQSVTHVMIDIVADKATSTAGSYNLVISKNGTPVATIGFTLLAGGLHQVSAASLSFVTSDSLTMKIVPVGGPPNPYWHQVTISLGTAVFWHLYEPTDVSTAFPAGTYVTYRGL
jgi:hypothetical protein